MPLQQLPDLWHAIPGTCKGLQVEITSIFRHTMQAAPEWQYSCEQDVLICPMYA